MSFKVCIQKKLRNFDLKVNCELQNSHLGILGTSGSGKSMLLKCIAGIETPDTGYIRMGERVLFDSDQKINLSPQERNVGYLFQNYALFPHLSVKDNICCGFSKQTKDMAGEFQTLLNLFHLQGLEEALPAKLSGGQSQRVALARMLASKPELLLLDEPFSALDSCLKEELWWKFWNYLDGFSGKILMVSHNRDEIFGVGGEVLVLRQGKQIEFTATKKLFQNPSTALSAKLVGCQNISRIQRIDQNHVIALDWGIPLATAVPVTNIATHIGIFPHHFTFCNSQKKTDNQIVCQILKKYQTFSGYEILFHPKNSSWMEKALIMKTNTLTMPESAATIIVKPENILVLKDS